MIVFVDANVLFDDYARNTISFKILERLCRTRGYQLKIPHVAALEAERLYRERIQGYQDDLKKLLQTGEVSMAGTGVLKEAQVDIEGLVRSYSDSLFGDAKHDEMNVELVYNTADHKTLALDRVISGKRPSKYRSEADKTKGSVNLRDTLIWLVIVEFAKAQAGKYILITKDSDFYDEKDGGGLKLHRDLVTEFSSTLPDSDIKVYKTLKDFLNSLSDITTAERKIIEAQVELEKALNELDPLRTIGSFIGNEEFRISSGTKYTMYQIYNQNLELGDNSIEIDWSTHPEMIAARESERSQKADLMANYPDFYEKFATANKNYEDAYKNLVEAERDALKDTEVN